MGMVLPLVVLDRDPQFDVLHVGGAPFEVGVGEVSLDYLESAVVLGSFIGLLTFKWTKLEGVSEY